MNTFDKVMTLIGWRLFALVSAIAAIAAVEHPLLIGVSVWCGLGAIARMNRDPILQYKEWDVV